MKMLWRNSFSSGGVGWHFTFIEVVVAVAILALSLTAILGISGTASARIAKSQREWSDAHRTAQAAEYYLLVGGAEGGIPADFFPYKDCSASFEIVEPQALPDGAESFYAGWRLASCVVTLRDGDGGLLSSVAVEKILKEDDE